MVKMLSIKKKWLSVKWLLDILYFYVNKNTASFVSKLFCNSSLEHHLQKLECHFTWDLGSSKNELKVLLSNLNDVNQERCTWLIHYYNLMGYIQQTLGSNTEALMNLHKAESVMQELGPEEAGLRLQVNKANLAWVYFLMGEMDESKNIPWRGEEPSANASCSTRMCSTPWSQRRKGLDAGEVQ